MTLHEAPMLTDDLFTTYSARSLALRKGDVLFHQGDTATHFFQVRSGRVKMVTYNEQGREFLHGSFTEGQSFGEPPFFSNTPYPSSAIAVVDSVVWKCAAEDFFRLLKEHFAVHLHLTRVLSGRLVYKTIMLTEIAVEEAEHRLATLIGYFRTTMDPDSPLPWRVPFTRQQLAEMTGLRTETVIRTIKSMEQHGCLHIDEHGKILWLRPDHD